MHAAIEKARQNSASESSGAGITCRKETAPAVLPPVVPAPDDIEDEGELKGRREGIYSTEAYMDRLQHQPAPDTVLDNCPTDQYTKAFLSTGVIYLSRFAIGLTSFRITSFGSLIASASVTALKSTGFIITLSNSCRTRSANIFKIVSCSWLELNNQDLDMQCGVWSLPGQHLWYDDEIYTTHNSTQNITFPFPYAEAPQVLVWLK